MESILYRVLHIAATCTSLGGLFYARMVLLPNSKSLPPELREVFLKKMIKRFSYIKWAGVTVVAITGIIQWMSIYPDVADKEMYLISFLVKMIGALGLFSITFLLTIPSTRMQKRRSLWSAINIFCGLTILIGAAMMKSVREGF